VTSDIYQVENLGRWVVAYLRLTVTNFILILQQGINNVLVDNCKYYVTIYFFGAD
jgi:hypothetical protein